MTTAASLPRVPGDVDPESVVELLADCRELPASLSSSPAVPAARTADPRGFVIHRDAASVVEGMASYGS
jgi:hypothetical protein